MQTRKVQTSLKLLFMWERKRNLSAKCQLLSQLEMKEILYLNINENIKILSVKIIDISLFDSNYKDCSNLQKSSFSHKDQITFYVPNFYMYEASFYGIQSIQNNYSV